MTLGYPNNSPPNGQQSPAIGMGFTGNSAVKRLDWRVRPENFSV